MKRVLFIIFTLMLTLACVPEEKPSDSVSAGLTAVADKDGYSIKGVVSCSGIPLEGVMVSDGVHCAVTDLNGHYWLPTTIDQDLVWISMPSGYEVAVQNGWQPMFWHVLDYSKIQNGQVQQFDFELAKVNNDTFGLMVMTDVHIRGRHESIGNQTIDSLQFLSNVRPCMDNWASGGNNYAIVLGDMVQDSYVVKHNTGLPQYKSLLKDLGMMVFHVPGNHEYEKGTFDAVPEYPENREVKKYYRHHMGPSYYSFNLGKVHFVVLDGTIITGLKTSAKEDRISPRQLEWLRGDLSRAFDPMREDVPQKLVICCHQPFFSYTEKLNGVDGCVSNRNDVIKVLSDCNIKEAMILSGHVHYSEIVNELSVNSVKINQYTHPSVCGAFWIQDYNWDDTPNGWTEYSFAGASYSRSQHAFNKELDTQVIVNTDYTNADGKKCLVINVPAYEKGWSVKVQKGLGEVSELSQQKMLAPKYRQFYTENVDAYNGNHNISQREAWHHFVYPVIDHGAEYKVVVTEPDGTEHVGKYVVNN